MTFANTDSGILIFGWDEDTNSFKDVNVDMINSKIKNWNENLIKPTIKIEFITYTHDKGNGLIVLIPSVKDLASVKAKIKVRSGSHKVSLEGINLTNTVIEKQNKPYGHLYLSYLKQNYSEHGKFAIEIYNFLNENNSENLSSDLNNFILKNNPFKELIKDTPVNLNKNIEQKIDKIKPISPNITVRELDNKLNSTFILTKIREIKNTRTNNLILEHGNLLKYNKDILDKALKNYFDFKGKQKIYRLSLKIVCIGQDYSFFKHILARYFNAGGFKVNYSMTIGVDFMVARNKLENEELICQYWILNGSIGFYSVREVYYQDINALMYDFNSGSLDELDKFREKLIEIGFKLSNKPIFVLINSLKINGSDYQMYYNYLKSISKYFSSSVYIVNYENDNDFTIDQIEFENAWESFILDTFLEAISNLKS